MHIIRAGGGHRCTDRRDADARPAALQACIGHQGRAILGDAGADLGAEMDRDRIGRCVTLYGERDGVVRDRLLAAEGERGRDRVFGEIHMVAAHGNSCGRFLG